MIRAVDVASYIEGRHQTHSAPDVKQQLAAVRMLFDWLITGQIVALNPAAAVRGPKHVVKIGKTPVLEGNEWRTLLESIPTETLRDLRDRALIATLTYSFARVTAALRMKVEIFGRRAPDGRCSSTKKAANSTRCRVTTRWRRCLGLISTRPVSPTTAKAGFFGPVQDTTQWRLWMLPCLNPTPGA